MKDPTCIHPLALRNRTSGKIRFIHGDGKEHYFYSVVNRMTGDRMSGFDNEAPTVNDTMRWVKSVFRDIRIKAKVLEEIGDY